jgi:glycosyltransferase involved in cell wall biosynthesis
VKGSSLLTDVLLSQWLQALRSDILITTRSELHVAAAHLVPSEVRLVAQEHVHCFQRSEPVRRRVEACIDRIDALVVLTERDRHDDIEESPWPPSKISVIANAVQCPLRSPAVERRKVVVAAGRLTPQKGFDRLIDAFVPVARRTRTGSFTSSAQVPTVALKKQIKRREMSSHVRLMGWEDHRTWGEGVRV